MTYIVEMKRKDSKEWNLYYETKEKDVAIEGIAFLKIKGLDARLTVLHD